ncbi:DUF5780 domain-containing protein [uncultured Clostridium sp.]|uniref:DUF5780 domain-containing protein n=1 Tax=uncultured Clostridium sp. TaxID=59620 RepID=UPI0025D347E0|nr:DUF5780 domain-containing protein [uncultured Clostridium sp.]
MIKHYKKYVMITLVAALLGTVISGCRSNVEYIEENLKNDNYVKAVKKADSLTDENEKEEAQNLIINKIENIKNQYMDGVIDGTLAISDIGKFKSSSDEINQSIESVSEEIHMHMNSKKAFDDGVNFENDGEYKEALESYHLVSEEDAENYNEAQNRIADIRKKLKSEEVLSVEESRVIVTSRAHKDIYPDQMQIILKNNGNSIVRKFEATIFAYDENNNPIKIKGRTSEAEDYPFLGLADNMSINPGEEWGDQYGWSITNSNISKIEACVEYAEYDDGSTWDNPLYMEWLKEHWVDD